MTSRTLVILALCALAFASCDEDDDTLPCDVTAGTLAGGPFAVTQDGLVDTLQGISLTGASGPSSVFLVTDAEGIILELVPTLVDLQELDFDGFAGANSQIYHVSFQQGLRGANAGANVSEFTGCFELSNSLEVAAESCPAVGGTLTAGTLSFDVDEEPDFLDADSLELSGAEGEFINYVITNASDSTIVQIVDDLDALTTLNLSSVGAGDYLLWGLARNSRLDNAAAGTFALDVLGCYALSNSVPLTIGCPASGGSLEGGPFVFEIDGESDFIDPNSLSLTDASGDSSTYVVTTDAGIILGLPSDLDALAAVDFNAAGQGRCLVYHLSYNGPTTGLEPGADIAAIEGCAQLSNSVIVQRVCTATGGTLAGGPFDIAIDTMPDAAAATIDVSEIVLVEADGEASTYVVTDADGVILGLPPTLDALGEVDFGAAGAGTCLVWHLSSNGPITGAEVGMDATAIEGCADLSNSLEVVRSLP